MPSKFRLECRKCGWTDEPSLQFHCPLCRGAVEAVIDLDRAKIHPDVEPEWRYFDFLPLVSRQFLTRDGSRSTPCRLAAQLGEFIGIPELWIKDESQQPSGSTKDRLANVVIAALLQNGVSEFVSASTGNTAISLSRAAARNGNIRGHFFCGSGAAGGELIDLSGGNTLTVVSGPYTNAIDAAHSFAAENQIFSEGGFFSWARREGLKIAYIEAFDQMTTEPTVVAQAISSGMGMMAARKAAEEYVAVGRLSRPPKLLMVQEATCAPMAMGWADKRAYLDEGDIVGDPQGLASAILLGDAREPYEYMHEIASETGGSIVTANRSELIEARNLLRELENLEVCYASAATFAAVRNEAAAGRISKKDVVLLNLTGQLRTAYSGSV